MAWQSFQSIVTSPIACGNVLIGSPMTKPSPAKLDSATEAIVRRMLATPPAPRSLVKDAGKKPAKRRVTPAKGSRAARKSADK